MAIQEMSMDVPPQQPDLIPSNTTDDDDDGDDDDSSHREECCRGGVSEEEKRRYVLRYEKMLLQQESEELATMAYMGPILEKLVELGSSSSTDRKNIIGHSENQWPMRKFQYVELKQALKKLESTQECMKTDQQLIMVLRSLTEKVDTRSSRRHEETITWMEFVQCYRLCVLGMLTLKHLPKATSPRSRTRDRTLEMMALFEPGMRSSSCLEEGSRDAIVDKSRSIVTRELPVQEMTEPATTSKSIWRIAVGVVLFCAFACMLALEQPTYVKLQENGTEANLQQRQSRQSNGHALFQEGIKRISQLVDEEARPDLESSMRSETLLHKPVSLDVPEVSQDDPTLSKPMGLIVSAAAVVGGAVGILGVNWILPMFSDIRLIPIGIVAVSSVAITSVARGAVRWITKLIASKRHEEAN